MASLCFPFALFSVKTLEGLKLYDVIAFLFLWFLVHIFFISNMLLNLLSEFLTGTWKLLLTNISAPFSSVSG